MDIHHMDELVTDHDISPQTPAPLILAMGQIVISRKPNGKTAERHISILAPVEWPVLAEPPRISTKRLSQPPHLIKRRPLMRIYNFLQSDHIRIQLADYFRDAL